jgi:spermidine synthase
MCSRSTIWVCSALLFGIINAAVALWSTFLFRDEIGRAGRRASSAIVLALLGVGMANRADQPAWPTIRSTPTK